MELVIKSIYFLYIHFFLLCPLEQWLTLGCQHCGNSHKQQGWALIICSWANSQLCPSSWWESSMCWFFVIIFVWFPGINGSIRDYHVKIIIITNSPSVQEESGLQLLLNSLLSWSKYPVLRSWMPSTCMDTFQLLVLSDPGWDSALVTGEMRGHIPSGVATVPSAHSRLF